MAANDLILNVETEQTHQISPDELWLMQWTVCCKCNLLLGCSWRPLDRDFITIVCGNSPDDHIISRSFGMGDSDVMCKSCSDNLPVNQASEKMATLGITPTQSIHVIYGGPKSVHSNHRMVCPSDCNSDCIKRLHQKRMDYVLARIEKAVCPRCERLCHAVTPIPSSPKDFREFAERYMSISLKHTTCLQVDDGDCDECRNVSQIEIPLMAFRFNCHSKTECQPGCKGECLNELMDPWMARKIKSAERKE